MKTSHLLLLTALLVIVTPRCLRAADLASPDDFCLHAEFCSVYRDAPADTAVTRPNSERFQKSTSYTMYAQTDDYEEESWEEDEDSGQVQELDEIADPLEPVNRAFFAVNDKLYFWILKPVAQAYSFVFPEQVRISVNNFFDNVTTPIRFVNNLLQLKFASAGKELLRFGINSTVGLAGIFDVAGDNEGITVNEDEDFGQTLGTWGLGPGFYINLPILGPSSLRDTVGDAGDYFLDPVNYVDPLITRYAIKTGSGVNKASFKIGDYEGIKKDALDPYTAIRDIYHQYRKSKVSR